MSRVLATVGVLIVVTLVAVATISGRDDRRLRDTPTGVVNPAPSPVTSRSTTPGGSAARSAPPAAPSPARHAAQRFLTGYLALLYGRGPVNAVTDITPAVRRHLAAGIQRVPQAQRMRRPEVVDLKATVQAPGVVMVTASIEDGDLAVYSLVFTVERRDTRWRVAELADH